MRNRHWISFFSSAANQSDCIRLDDTITKEGSFQREISIEKADSFTDSKNGKTVPKSMGITINDDCLERNDATKWRKPACQFSSSTYIDTLEDFPVAQTRL